MCSTACPTRRSSGNPRTSAPGSSIAASTPLCESDSTPMHIGSIPAYLRGIDETLHDPWQPGDIVIHNHPYYGASHSPDIAAVAPVFYEGELVGYSANTAHHVDIGAATPGLIIDVPDVFAEGMLFKGVKLYEGGVLNRALWQFIETNTRVPSQVMGDIEAQVASAELGVQALHRAARPARQGRGVRGDRAAHGLFRAHAAPPDRGDPGRRIHRRGIPRRRRAQPEGAAAGQGGGAHRGGFGRGRSHRLVTAGADRLQRALRRLHQGRLLLRLSRAAAGYRDDQRARAAERGLVPSHRGHGAQGHDLQSRVSGLGGGALQPNPAGGRLHRQGAGSGDPGEGDRWLLRRRLGDRLLRRPARRPVLGLHRGSTRAPAAAGPIPTGPTRSRN